MPRGVPASGKRQPRVSAASETEAEPTVAGGTLDFPPRVDESPAKEAAHVATFGVIDLDPEPVPEPRPDPRPVPDEELTPDQLEIKRLRDQLARREGKNDEEPQIEPIAVPGASSNIIIHFLEDGLTALGKVFYRGDELEFAPDSGAYRDTFNRNGVTWLDLRHDEFAQVERYGKVMFRNGPWPGKSYADGSFEVLRAEKSDARLAPPTEEELARAEKARKLRAAPRLPQRV